MDQVHKACMTLLIVSLSASAVNGAGYGRPISQQYPWNTYTTAKPPVTENQVTVTSSSTLPPIPPSPTQGPETNPWTPTNTLDSTDYVIVLDTETNQQYLMSRETFWERFLGRFRKSNVNSRVTRDVRMSSQDMNDMDAAKEAVLEDFPPSANEINVGPTTLFSYYYDRYGSPSPNRESLQRSFSPYFHSRTDGVSLLPNIFQNYNPFRAIYSYSALGRLCAYGECNYSTFNNNGNFNRHTVTESQQRSDFPPSTVRPRTAKVTSTWIPIIYRTSSSTEGKVEEPVITTTNSIPTTTESIPTEPHQNKLLPEITTTTVPDPTTTTTTTTTPAPVSSSTEQEEIAETTENAPMPTAPASLESLEEEYEDGSVRL